MIGSDSLSLHAGPGPHPGKPHPRSYGTFPRVLGVYCREKRLFSWETAVHKMTGMAGGQARPPGPRPRAPRLWRADLALFDPATVRDEATFPDPHRHPAGIPYVVVNGQVVVDGPRFDALPAGRVLTPGGVSAVPRPRKAEARRAGACGARLKVWVVFDDRVKFGDGRAELLELVDELGSFKKAVARIGMSYRGAWGYFQELERAAGFKLLERHPGGGPEGGTAPHP